MTSKTKKLLITIVIIVSLTIPTTSTIWDNIFSQTGASHPINLTQSFNIDFQLPKQYELDGNFDFNSQLKTLTLKLSKNILIQKIDIIKAQIDLQQLVLNVDQFLLGCEKFMLGVEDQVNDKIKQKVSKVGVSKRSLNMINLLFKYIGRYEIKSHNKKSNKNPQQKTQPNSIFDMLKDNKLFDQLEQALGVDLQDKKDSQLKGIQFYDMFEFSITDLIPKNPKEIVSQLEKNKQKAKEQLGIQDENKIIQTLNLQQINFDMLKFIILTNPRTGEIVKAYKNKDMKQEMQFKLHSLQKTKAKCNKQAKKLTLQDLTNGAKYLYDNKDTIGNVLNV